MPLSGEKRTNISLLPPFDLNSKVAVRSSPLSTRPCSILMCTVLVPELKRRPAAGLSETRLSSLSTVQSRSWPPMLRTTTEERSELMFNSVEGETSRLGARWSRQPHSKTMSATNGTPVALMFLVHDGSRRSSLDFVTRMVESTMPTCTWTVTGVVEVRPSRRSKLRALGYTPGKSIQVRSAREQRDLLPRAVS